ncbi:MAG TPA: hypothetical protein VEK80_05420 [Kribbellaceae bacterium]|nr:hypothetical protein [Kribbellaceae bacterium]
MPAENAKVVSVPPPKAVLAVVNPVVKVVAKTPLGRVLGSTGTLTFTGRRSGTRLEVATGIHDLEDGTYGVFSSWPWRLNFRGGAQVEVRLGGRLHHGRAELIDAPAVIGPAFKKAMKHASTRTLGLQVERGHEATEAELGVTGRELIRITFDD